MIWETPSSSSHLCKICSRALSFIPGVFTALQTIWGEGEYREDMDEMLAEQAALERAPPKSALQLLKSKDVRWQLVSISVIVCCNGLSGISAVTTLDPD